MLIETLVIAVLIGWFKHGTLKNIENITLNGWQIILAGLFAKSIPMLLRIISVDQEVCLSLAPWFFVASILMITIGLCVSFSLLPVKIILTGASLNLTVIVLNAGCMPVSTDAMRFAGFTMSKLVSQRIDLFHVVMGNWTKLAFLGDIIPIPKPYIFPQILSIGDILMCIGAFLFVIQAMKKNTIANEPVDL